ncbi:hypothetical protein FRACYDRAFT_232708 [Fragilariopsis cylindrus CCMP1102]|uniref:Uncharacterized protein n=1 Tax=Fragilariopsis cylindrus CCMP1102 TaxID=635003 RepID=A0A1E7FWM0_9STRA|nr:hypothetical protein FRACYDRAFT_232708 [Fragilariopsis cylindrus CCMP1102]|eukprot:OEU22550.1 hypothetical protein FRACYDRAFT_232708 [Fragilariopsis cylindrus CCMP1102]
MNEVDRQQQHSRDRGGIASSLSASTSVETTPPRLVTPNPTMVSPGTINFEYRHKPTASNDSLKYTSPMRPKEPNMRFNLSNNSTEKEKFAKADNNDFNPRKVPSSTSRQSSGSRSSNLHRSTRSSSKRDKSTTNGDTSSSSKSKLLSNNSSLRKHDPNSYKIFLLLLQPKLKTFELIQLIYSPNDTTIGNIIEMIPENATEPALGSQHYTGLCRPKTQEEIVDHELLASEPRSNTGVESAKITLGEILVAIPDGYNGTDVAVLAKQILSNPKIVKLLKRSDPLAPKRSRRSSKRGHKKTSRRSRSKEHVEVMEQFDEEDEIKQEQEKKESERRMREAMEHAAQKAAASNAEIPGSTNPSSINNIINGGNIVRSPSIVSLDGSGSIEEEKSVESSLQESIDESYSSWSKSFDASFASTVCSGLSKRSFRRRDRHSRRMRIIQRSVVTAFVIMLAMYFLDPRGYQRSDQEKLEDQAATTENPMGLTGILQCLFLLLSLYQVESIIRTSTTDLDEDGQRQSSFVEFLQSTMAMKKLKSRFSKKFKKPATRGAVGKYDLDDNTLTQKLRSFSLKQHPKVPTSIEKY